MLRNDLVISITAPNLESSFEKGDRERETEVEVVSRPVEISIDDLSIKIIPPIATSWSVQSNVFYKIENSIESD